MAYWLEQGDLVILSGLDWSETWRGMPAIVQEKYETPFFDDDEPRWIVMSARGTAVTYADEVELIQDANGAHHAKSDPSSRRSGSLSRKEVHRGKPVRKRQPGPARRRNPIGGGPSSAAGD